MGDRGGATNSDDIER